MYPQGSRKKFRVCSIFKIASSDEEGASSNRRTKPCSPCGKLIADHPEIKSKLLAFARDLQLDEIEREFGSDAAATTNKPLAEDNISKTSSDKKSALLQLQSELSSDLQIKDPFCREKKQQTYDSINKDFSDYKFSKVVDLSYPLEPCALLGLEQFVNEKRSTHWGTRQRANFTESDAAAMDRKLVQGLAGLLGLQQAKYLDPLTISE